ncbi:MAG: hypothetical protein RSH78_00220 [Bacilli bacterium]|uniref:hypothetical protein n=1 Tax=Clostridium sp. TaxID=1506 RepID=UPI002FC62EE5
MTVKALTSFVLDTAFRIGVEYDLDKKIAERLIENGLVAAVEKETKKTTKKK